MTDPFSHIPPVTVGIPGLFVVLEGIDGSGTTSQMHRVATELRNRGRIVHATQQPSDHPIGRQIRAALAADSPVHPETLALMFAADRLDHYRREIEPAVLRGDIVVCDRYLFSSWAYQPLSCHGGWVREINRYATFPDCTILLDIDADVAKERRIERGGPRERFDDVEIQKKVATNYRKIANEWPVHVLDGSLSMDIVTLAILDIIEARLS